MEKKIFVFGSSISWGAWDREGGWVDRLKRFVNSKVIDTNEKYWGMIYNQSISGDTTTGILERFERELALRLGENQDVYVVFEIGINDSLFINDQKEFQVPLQTFESNMEQLIKLSKKYAKHILFIGAAPVIDEILDPIPWHTTGTYSTKYIQKFNETILTKCKDNDAEYIDLFTEFNSGNLKELLCPDGVHFSTKGHELTYNILKQLLGKLKAFD